MTTTKQIAVDLHPDLVDAAALADSAVVVVDVLRATTTAVFALAAAAREVVICAEVDEAREKARACWQSAAVLGGERNGVKIDGFDLGNSPSEYTRATVAGRAVFFTTTNGTRALLKCRSARRVVAGALVNRHAVVRALTNEPKVRIVCAGTRGEITRDDALTAGAIVAGLVDPHPHDYELDDEAEMVRDAWNGLMHPLANRPPEVVQEMLHEALRRSMGGRHLMQLGLDADIAAASHLDTIEVLPELDAAQMCLRVR